MCLEQLHAIFINIESFLIPGIIYCSYNTYSRNTIEVNFVMYQINLKCIFISRSSSADVSKMLNVTAQQLESYQLYFLSLQMQSMTLSLSVPLLPTSRASSVVVVFSVSLADMKRRRKGRKKNLANT